jgi:hypothetical protein
MAREDEDRHARHSGAQPRERRERIGSAAALHELDNQQNGDIGTQLLDGQAVESGARDRVGIELDDGTAHQAGELQAQIEIVMHHQAQPAGAR